MSQTPFIFDVTSANFEQLVLENSFHKPVLVDFWAEWCAPCKALMPLLAKITEEYQGELLLAKVNCDIEQEVVARFGVRSLPTVVLFKDGQPVDGFAGAQPESAIRAMLEPHVQLPPAPEADQLEAAQALFAEGRIGEAENLLKQLLAEDNENAAVLILYARCLAERAELGEKREAIIAVTIPEQPGSFKRFCQAVGKRQITEFNYRYHTDGNAHIFVGVQTHPELDPRSALIDHLRKQDFPVLDLTDNELAKLHIRHMVGGHADAVSSERVFRFEFPERPGALFNFLNRLGGHWNISMFHYRNHGAAHGRVLAALQVPDDEQHLLSEALDEIGYPYWDETENPAYQLFLG